MEIPNFTINILDTKQHTILKAIVQINDSKISTLSLDNFRFMWYNFISVMVFP